MRAGDRLLACHLPGDILGAPHPVDDTLDMLQIEILGALEYLKEPAFVVTDQDGVTFQGSGELESGDNIFLDRLPR